MCQNALLLSYTLKTPRSDLTRKRVPWGQTHSWVRLIWNPGKNDRNLSPKCLSDSDSGWVWLGFRVGLTPKWVSELFLRSLVDCFLHKCSSGLLEWVQVCFLLIIFLYAVELCYHGNGYEFIFSPIDFMLFRSWPTFNLTFLIQTNLVSNEREKRTAFQKYWVINRNKRYRAEIMHHGIKRHDNHPKIWQLKG